MDDGESKLLSSSIHSIRWARLDHYTGQRLPSSFIIFISIQLFDDCVAALTRPITNLHDNDKAFGANVCVRYGLSLSHILLSPASSIYDLLCHTFQDFISLFILNANSRLSDTVINQSEQRLP